MNTLQSSLFAVAIGYCLLCAMSLSQLPKLHARYFSAYLVLSALAFGFEWLVLHPQVPLKALWLGLLMALSLCVAPTLWLCVREVTGNNTTSIRDLPRRQRSLIVLGQLATLPLIFSAHTGTSFTNPHHVLSATHAMIIHSTMLACVAVFCVQTPFFLYQSLKALGQHESRVRQLFSNLQDRSLNALRLLIVVVAIKWLMNILRTMHCMLVGPGGGLELNIFMSLEIAATLWVLFVVFRHHRTTSGEQQLLVRESTQTVPEAKLEPAKYTNSALDTPARQRILTKLHKLMVEEAAYRNSEFSLKLLSEMTRESPHYLSQVINQDLGDNFYEWVNRHRIDAAKHALLERPDLSVLEISELVGFNAKSTFNAAFRRQVGLTPSQFRRQFALTGADRSNRAL